ncbi:MAG: polysaccharide deacetylase family protein [Oscillospiraceae bacterium]|jgi:peptidoglycan/xylan/chitin deacetylase (PgdA/CDA1 family)|nr:polysaccharide deacetylase family protein [Oscillospiraceae bacterium]
MTFLIGLAKRGKRIIKRLLKRYTKVYLSQVRRIERVKTAERVVAMTFDDGPCAEPPSPDAGGAASLTGRILDKLAEFGARGTFNVVGDTSENYPDEKGADGTPYWSGTRFDHYPSFGADALGGAKNQPELIRRMLAEGHEISSHGYRHIIFGESKSVYGKRESLGAFDAAVADLQRLHGLMEREYGCTLTLHRPPHYVDKLADGTTSYDVCEKLGYQYVGASFDGCDWLPLAAGYEAEVRHTRSGLAALLERDPDALCGQIIFSKDGFNMAHRSPVADGLALQLETLSRYGYRVVTVTELLRFSPLADLDASDALFGTVCELLNAGRTVAFADNTIRLAQTLTRGELLLMFAEDAAARRVALIKSGKRAAHDVPATHPYSGAVGWAAGRGLLPRDGRARPGKPADYALLDRILAARGNPPTGKSGRLSRAAALTVLSSVTA